MALFKEKPSWINGCGKIPQKDLMGYLFIDKAYKGFEMGGFSAEEWSQTLNNPEYGSNLEERTKYFKDHLDRCEDCNMLYNFIYKFISCAIEVTKEDLDKEGEEWKE